MSFRRRQAITAALTANAIRPLPGQVVGVPSFFAGWLTGELAPQVLALTAADAAATASGSAATPSRSPCPPRAQPASATWSGRAARCASGSRTR